MIMESLPPTAAQQQVSTIKQAIAAKDNQIQKLVAAGQLERYLKNKWALQCEELRNAYEHAAAENRRIPELEAECAALGDSLNKARADLEEERQDHVNQVIVLMIIVRRILLTAIPRCCR